MPSTLISIRKPRPPAERAAIMDAVHAAMVEAIRIPADDRCLRIQQFDAADFAVGPQFGDNFTLVEITLFSGRSLDVKRVLYKTIVASLGELGIAPYDVRIILNEVTPENWGLRGGTPGSEINVGFKVNV
jgi:phenylpyruvate tautomerase PptA (4-oxalocrotonate tautomerase family)